MSTENTTLDAGTNEAPKVKRERIVGKPVTVSVSSVIAALEAGKSRKVIKKELGLTADQAKQLFDKPQIKGKKMHYSKTSTKAPITIIDDVEMPVEGEAGDATITAQGNGTSNGAENAGVRTAEQAAQPVQADSDSW